MCHPGRCNLVPSYLGSQAEMLISLARLRLQPLYMQSNEMHHSLKQSTVSRSKEGSNNQPVLLNCMNRFLISTQRSSQVLRLATRSRMTLIVLVLGMVSDQTSLTAKWVRVYQEPNITITNQIRYQLSARRIILRL